MQLLLAPINLIRKNPLLALILIVGFLLRIISTTPGYYYPIGDELLYGQAIHMLLNRTLSFETPYFGFPPLIPWIMLPVFALVFIPLGFLKVVIIRWNEIYLYLPILIIPFAVFLILLKRIFHLTKQKLFKIFITTLWIILITGGIVSISVFPIMQREILGRDWINALYWGRYLTAFIGSLVILLTFKVTFRYFKNTAVALISAFFVSVNYRMVLSSHIGLPDMFNVFFLLLALFAIGKLLENQSFEKYLLAFLSMASFFMIKYQTHILLPFLVMHTAISIKNAKKSLGKFLKIFFSRKVIIAGIIGLIFIIIAHFYHFKNWGRVLEINDYEAIKYGFGRNIIDLFPIAYLYHVGIGPPLSIISLLGIILGFINKKTQFATLTLVSVIPTFAFLYLYYTNGGLYTRNVISTIPIFLIFAAYFIHQTYEILLKNVQYKQLVTPIYIFAIFLFARDNITNSVITARAYSQEAPRTRAQNWVDANIGEGVVFGAFLGTTWPKDPKIQAENSLPYYKAFSYQEMLKEKYDYMSIELSNVRDQFTWWMRQTPRIQIAFWDKPNDLLSQNYYSLAFREFIWRGGQEMFISPWQAPSHNFAIVKIDKNTFSKVNFTLLKKLADLQSWKQLYFLPNYSEDSKNLLSIDGGNLVIKSERVLPGSSRHESESFQIKEGYAYKVTAEIENTQTILKEERDGFIRLDFYDHIPSSDILARPKMSFVSERIYGGTGWHKVEITAIAPPGAKFGALGVQADGASKSNLYIRNIEVYESKSLVQDSWRHFTISDDDLFLPNNDGVL